MKNGNPHKFRTGVFLSLIFTIFIFPYSIQAAPGDLDPSFGIGGKVTTSTGAYGGQIKSLAIQPDGKIIAAGTANTSYTTTTIPCPFPPCPVIVVYATDLALARYNVDGSLDTAFGNGGKVVTDFGSVINAVVLQSDNKIVAVGGANSDFALARYNPDGSPGCYFWHRGKSRHGLWW